MEEKKYGEGGGLKGEQAHWNKEAPSGCRTNLTPGTTAHRARDFSSI